MAVITNWLSDTHVKPVGLKPKVYILNQILITSFQIHFDSAQGQNYKKMCHYQNTYELNYG